MFATAGRAVGALSMLLLGAVTGFGTVAEGATVRGNVIVATAMSGARQSRADYHCGLCCEVEPSLQASAVAGLLEAPYSSSGSAACQKATNLQDGQAEQCMVWFLSGRPRGGVLVDGQSALVAGEQMPWNDEACASFCTQVSARMCVSA